MKITNPHKLLEMAGIYDYIVDWEKHIVYLESMQKLSEYCGMNWSVLAEEVEWRGWKWRNLE